MMSVYRALTAIAAAALGACAHDPAPTIRYGGDAPSLALVEARAIEAAKRHPNAQPRVRPQYPEQAPPPLPAGTSLPAPLHITRRSAPYVDTSPPSEVVVQRNVYVDSPYRYGYGYSYRRPYGMGWGWDPYGYGYYNQPRFRYGYGYGGYGGYGLGVSLWRTPHFHYPRLHQPGRFWGGPGHHPHHWGSRGGFRGGFGFGFRSGGFNERSYHMGRRR